MTAGDYNALGASLGLYIHVPFCRAKCAYCDFYSVVPGPGQPEAYLVALRAEMRLRSKDPCLRGKRFATLYIGGGTPSMLSPQALTESARQAFEYFDFDREPEVTVEANPESAGPQFAEAAAALPGCRVSLGGQSFCRGVLKTLGRIHDPDGVRRAFGILRGAGVNRINLDLIYGSPGETLESWLRSLDAALDLGPSHVSAYCLSIEEETPLARLVEEGIVPKPDEGLQREQYAAARERLEVSGFECYEISNFAKPGGRSVHNQIYWHRGEYLGLGPAAHSFVGGARRCNHGDVELYCRALACGRDPVARRELISDEQALEETIMLGLRTSDGLDLEKIELEWGPGVHGDLLNMAALLAGEGLTTIAEGRLRIGPRGYFVSDEVIARLIPEIPTDRS